jgi:hypothetical protein
MDNQPSSISVPEGVAVTSPAPPVAMPAAPVEAAPPPMATPAAMPTQSSSGSINDFFKSINWLEAGFAVLGALGLYYTVYYYQYKIKEGKVANSDMQRQLDELKMNVQGAMKGKYQSL